jgi:hypothetical protein
MAAQGVRGAVIANTLKRSRMAIYSRLSKASKSGASSRCRRWTPERSVIP